VEAKVFDGKYPRNRKQSSPKYATMPALKSSATALQDKNLWAWGDPTASGARET
jgi:hypothetical protein